MNSDQKQSLGEFLRAERENRSITIEQVASATKISVRVLHSLESEHFSDLPARPFIRGFVTSYCRFIGLDWKEVLAHYDSYITEKVRERPNREAGHSGYAFERGEGQQSRTVLLGAVFTFIIVGGLATALLKPNFKRQRKGQVERLIAAYPPLVSPKASKAPMQKSSAASAEVQSTQADTSYSAVKVTRIIATKQKPPDIFVSPLPSISLSTQSGAQSSTQTEENAAGKNPADPLDSGLSLKNQEIKYKIIFKIKNETWVRYQVDQRPLRRFVIRKDKILVLRASQGGFVQFSVPEGIEFQPLNRRSQDWLSSPELKKVQANQTLFFGAQSTFYEERLAKEKPLPKYVPLAPASVRSIGTSSAQ